MELVFRKFFKRNYLITLATILLVGITMVSCEIKDKNFRERMTAMGVTEGFHNIFDDDQSTVVIIVNEELRTSFEESMADIMIKKKNWEQQNTTKKIVTMSVITSEGSDGPIIYALLIHYSDR